MQYLARNADGVQVSYVDRKRYGWLAAFISPALGISSVVLYLATQSALVLVLPLFYAFVVIPAIDGWLGEDTNNPPDAIVPLLSQDKFYRTLLYVDSAFLYASFLLGAWFVGTHVLPWWAYVAFALGAGMTSTDCIFVGHELGHKRSKVDRVAAQVTLGLVGYGHFTIEHNRGHHVHVSTPEDSASSRMGESIYRFVLREIPGAISRSWRLERSRLAAEHRSVWSVRNEILQSWAITASIAIALTATFGWIVTPFIVIHHLFAWYGLTQANYVEHYGLLRQKLPNGRYEIPQPKHSWNTNHMFSNLVTFHLQRHSDHHANALRPYQALRDVDGLPRLPSGYPGCFGLAMIPSLWYKVMDPKLLEWCGGDMTKLNIDPRSRAQLFAKYGVADHTSEKPASIPALDAALTPMQVAQFEATGEFDFDTLGVLAGAERTRDPRQNPALQKS